MHGSERIELMQRKRETTSQAQPKKLRQYGKYSGSPSSSQVLEAAEGVTASGHNSGIGHSKSCNMSKGVEIFSAFPTPDPKTFLPGTLKTGVIAFTLCSERIETFEPEAISVNRHAVIVRNCFVFCAATVLFAVVPVLVVTGAGACF